MSLITELKRRNVFRVAIAYLALAWLLIEVAGTLFPAFGIPEWAFRFVVIVLALGFAPTLIFSWAYEITPEGLKREKDVVRNETASRLTAKRLDWFTIGLVVVAFAFVMFDRLWLGQRLAREPAAVVQMDPDGVREPQVESPSIPNSIAVLPFANRSDNPKDVFFVDGIHDDLLTYISQIGSIKTISRTSVLQYRDSTKPIPEIARELGVATVLEGGVQRAGEQVRINVQLIDARTDDHLWAQIYDRQLTATNIFAIQSEIAGAIAEALRAELTPEARERIESVPTGNLAALEAYFLGRQKMATRVVADLAAAVEHFETAVALDPDFALAWAGLAESSALYQNYAGLPPEEWFGKSRAAAERALQLDPGLAEAYTADGLRKWYERDFEGAETAFKRAIQLHPNYATANQWYGYLLGISLGRMEEGLEFSRKAVVLDPKSAINLTDLGDVLRSAGRFDEALIEYQQAVALEPRFAKGYRRIGWVQSDGFGRQDLAILAYRKAAAIEPDSWSLSRDMGSIYLSLGDDQQAEHWISRALEKAPRGLKQMGAHLGRLYLYRGNRERAMEYFASAWASNPEDQLALYHLANHDLKAGDITAAIARYEQAALGLLDDEPAVDDGNHVAAIHLAGILYRIGERERADLLLDRALETVNSYDLRHLGDEAAIHVLRGNNDEAIHALSVMSAGERASVWREFVVDHPAFEALLDDPEFRVLDEAFEAEMARQLAQVREWEASRELAPLPNQ